MKFNWGTGIFIFIILFLSAAAVFIVFAMRQEVNLVHEDYYERGVDHSSQMAIDARSKPYEASVMLETDEEYLKIEVEEEVAIHMDSARIHLYRPSDSSHDMFLDFKASENPMLVRRADLHPGRYILKFTWSSGELRYEIHKTLIN